MPLAHHCKPFRYYVSEILLKQNQLFIDAKSLLIHFFDNIIAIINVVIIFHFSSETWISCFDGKIMTSFDTCLFLATR